MKIPTFSDHRGKLGFIQNSDQINFDIKGVYWSNLKNLEDDFVSFNSEVFLIALNGNITFKINSSEKSFKLTTPEIGIHIIKNQKLIIIEKTKDVLILIISPE